MRKGERTRDQEVRGERVRGVGGGGGGRVRVRVKFCKRLAMN